MGNLKKIAFTYSIFSSINGDFFFKLSQAHYEEHHMYKFLQAIFFVTFCTYFNCVFTLILNWPFSYDLKCDAMRLELTMVCVKSTLWGIKLPLRKRWDNRDLSYKCNNYWELSFSKKDFFSQRKIKYYFHPGKNNSWNGGLYFVLLNSSELCDF